ncbi:MAG: Macrolide export ATP-binding/permease protein MacB [Ilumatobacteraceae bacterium]|nr:Macrolide export ATP-binding/permease protein MacB [Ilumatobacteraceae bacterium]
MTATLEAPGPPPPLPAAPDNGKPLAGSRLRLGDVIRVGSLGLRTRRLRTGLSTLGVAIGIAAMVGVLGLSASSQEDLQAKIRALGTNLLEVQAGTGLGRGSGQLPATAVAMVSRIGPVTAVSSIATIQGAVRRTDAVSEGITSGISIFAADPGLLETLHGKMADGHWLDAATSTYPAVVLGSVAAQKLGITSVADELRVRINDTWFAVIGILEPNTTADGLDRSAIIGIPAAGTYLLDTDVIPEIIYVRTANGATDAVRAVLSNTVNPETPDEVEVSRPSDALAAEDAASNAFTSLFLGLGGVALLVGGIGIANVMVIAVIERRSEIGLRRALGATRAHIRRQFLTEAVLLAGAGGIVGVGLGAGVTAIYAHIKHWQVVVPPVAIAGGLVAAVVIGGLAGLYPASRAARLPPTEALRSN